MIFPGALLLSCATYPKCVESLVIYQSLCENLQKTAPVLYAILQLPDGNAVPSAEKGTGSFPLSVKSCPQDDLSAFRFCSFFSKDAAPGSDLLHRDLLLAAQRNELLRHSVIGDHRRICSSVP